MQEVSRDAGRTWEDRGDKALVSSQLDVLDRAMQVVVVVVCSSSCDHDHLTLLSIQQIWLWSTQLRVLAHAETTLESALRSPEEAFLGPIDPQEVDLAKVSVGNPS